MADLQGNNVGITWGSGMTGSPSWGGVARVVQSQGESITLEADQTEVKSSSGETVGLVINNRKSKISLTVWPSSTTPSTSIPSIGNTFTLTSTDSYIAGKWIVSASSKAYSSEGVLEFSLEGTRPYQMSLDDSINAE